MPFWAVALAPKGTTQEWAPGEGGGGGDSRLLSAAANTPLSLCFFARKKKMKENYRISWHTFVCHNAEGFFALIKTILLLNWSDEDK